MNRLYAKDEGLNRSCSKRGLAVAVMRAGQRKGRRRTHRAMPGARWRHMRRDCDCAYRPRDIPAPFAEIRALGAEIAGGRLITDCARLVKQGADEGRWFDLSTLKEPYRLEGKKTMGLELAEQFDWQLPDVIVYPPEAGRASWASGRRSPRWKRSAGLGRRAHVW
jgi:threonine synthase